MTTTVGNLVTTTERHLLGTHRADRNRLATTMTDSVTSLVVEFQPGRGIGAGAYLALDDEIVYVWEYGSTSLTATIQRAQLGTTAAAHTAGAIVDINPRFPRPILRDTLKEEIDSWGPAVYQVKTLDIAVGSTAQAVDLTAIGTYYSVLRVYREPRSGSDVWFNPTFRVLRNMPTADFASGTALILDGQQEAATNLRIVYSAPFTTTTFTDATDLNATVGLDASQNDIPPYGAAWRLLATREVRRTQTQAQGDPRNAEEVPAGFMSQTSVALKRIRDQRLADAAVRLSNLYPPRHDR